MTPSLAVHSIDHISSSHWNYSSVKRKLAHSDQMFHRQHRWQGGYGHLCCGYTPFVSLPRICCGVRPGWAGKLGKQTGRAGRAAWGLAVGSASVKVAVSAVVLIFQAQNICMLFAKLFFGLILNHPSTKTVNKGTWPDIWMGHPQGPSAPKCP